MSKKSEVKKLDPPSDELFDVLPESLPEEVEQLKNEFAGDFAVHAQKRNPKTMQFERIAESFPVDSFDANSVSLSYGGGTYRFTVRDPNGQYVKKFTVTYAEKNIPAAPAIKEDNSFRMVELITAEQKASMTRYENMLTLTMQNLTQMVTAMMSKPQSSSLDDLIKYKQIFPEHKSDGNEMNKVVEVLKLGVELARGQMDNAGDTSPTDEVMKQFIQYLAPKIPQILSGRGENKPMNIQQSPAAANAAPAIKENISNAETTPPTAEPNPPASIEKYVMEVINDNYKRILSLAKKGMDTGIVAGFVCEPLSNESYLAMVEYFETTGSDKVLEKFPELRLYEKWVNDLVSNIISYFPDEPDAPQPADVKPEEKTNADTKPQ